MALLVSHGADLAAAGVYDGRPPLFFAAALGAADVVAMMLARRADPDARCLGGLSALHFAAAHGAIGSVRMLLARGAQPELVDGDGRLPVAHALRGVPGHSLPARATPSATRCCCATWRAEWVWCTVKSFHTHAVPIHLTQPRGALSLRKVVASISALGMPASARRLL